MEGEQSSYFDEDAPTHCERCRVELGNGDGYDLCRFCEADDRTHGGMAGDTVSSSGGVSPER